MDLSESDEWGLTALHYAALHGNVDLIDELCHRRAPVHARDRYGQTPLLVACTHGHHAAIARLLEYRSSVHAASTSGYTPLHRTAMSASPHAALSATLLLQHKAAVNATTAPPGAFTPLRVAVRASRIDVVAVLCGAGAVVAEADIADAKSAEMRVELLSWTADDAASRLTGDEERRRGRQRRDEREKRAREAEEHAAVARGEEDRRRRSEEARRRTFGAEVEEGLSGRWAREEEELSTARRMEAEAEAEERKEKTDEEAKDVAEDDEDGEAVAEDDTDQAERLAYRERMFALWRQKQEQPVEASSASAAKNAWA